MVGPRIERLGGTGFGKPALSVLKFGREPSLAALCFCFCTLHTKPDTAHGPIGTGRPRARRRFGYWGEQIGHLRDQSGHHFGAGRAVTASLPHPTRCSAVSGNRASSWR